MFKTLNDVSRLEELSLKITLFLFHLLFFYVFTSHYRIPVA